MSHNFWSERSRRKIETGRITAADNRRADEFFKNYLRHTNPRGSLTHLIPSAQYASEREIRAYNRAIGLNENAPAPETVCT